MGRQNRYTGYLLLGSVALQQPDLTKGDDAKVQESLARASKLAETLLQRTDGANGLPEELRDRVQKYVKNLERILTPETRTDSGELDQLEGGTIKEVPLSSNARSEEWLESGLIWASPPPNEPNGLLGFAHYPFLRTRRHGTLVSLLIAQLMSGEKSERDEK